MQNPFFVLIQSLSVGTFYGSPLVILAIFIDPRTGRTAVYFISATSISIPQITRHLLVIQFISQSPIVHEQLQIWHTDLSKNRINIPGIPAQSTGQGHASQSTLGQHSSPQYRSSLLGTDSSSPRYKRSAVCNVSIPAQCTGRGYLTDPARSTTDQVDPQYAPSAFQPTVQAQT